MRELDPFIRSCFLAVMIAAAPALLIAAMEGQSLPPERSTFYACIYAGLMVVTFVFFAKRSSVWRTPVAINIVFFLFITIATLTL
jgi:hypothetical protein